MLADERSDTLGQPSVHLANSIARTRDEPEFKLIWKVFEGGGA